MDISVLQTPSTKTSDGHIFESSHDPSHVLGKLFVFVELTSAQIREHTDIDALIEFVESSYYEHEEHETSPDPVRALENIAIALNQSLDHFFSHLDPKTVFSHVHIFIGVLHDSELHFTKTSHTQVLLLHGSNLIDVADSNDDDTKSPRDDLLSYITSGSLTKHDRILISGNTLLDYFSEGKLKHILANPTSEAARDEFATLVEEFSKQTHFQALIIAHETSREKARVISKGDPEPSSQKSMHELNSLEYSTGNVLSGSFFASLRHHLDRLRSPSTEHLENTSSSDSSGKETDVSSAAKRRIRERSTFHRVINVLYSGATSLFAIFTWLFEALFRSGSSLFKNRSRISSLFRSGKYALPSLARAIPSATHRIVTHHARSYRMLNRRRRILLLSSLALALVLIISIVFDATKRSSDMSQEEITAILDDIEVKYASAHAALLYGNDAKAASLVAETRRLLTELDIRDDALSERKQELATKLYNTYASVQRLEKIDNPEVVAMIDIDETGQSRDLLSLTGKGDTFYGYDRHNTVYTFSIPSGSIDTIATSVGDIVSLDQFTDTQLLLQTTSDNERSLYTLNTLDAVISEFDITFNNPSSEKPNITPYFSRMYVLDPRERQIYKHSRVGSTYTRGTPWVTDETVDLSESLSMAIDGSIWVSTKSGNIIKLSAGEKEDFATPALDPPLNFPSKIWTSVDSNRLYIIDPPTRRLVVLNKDGTIFKQLVSEKFNDLRGMVIDEVNNNVYLLNQDAIYVVSIE